MTIQDITTRVNQAVAGTSFTLSLNTLNSAPLNLLSNAYILNNTLKLTVGSTPINAKRKSITVTGIGVDAPFTGLNIVATFTVDSSQNAQLEINATARPNWKLSNSIPGLQNTIADQIAFNTNPAPSLRVVSDQTNPVAPNMSFVGNIDVTATSAGLATFLAKQNIRVTGNMLFEQNGASLKTFELNGPQLDGVNLIIAQNVTLGFNLGINQYLDHVNNIRVSIPYIKLLANIPFTAQGTTYQLPLSVQISNFETPIRFSADINGLINAGINELTALTGGVGISTYIPNGFDIGSLITVSGFFLDYNLTTNTIDVINLTVNSTSTWTILNSNSPAVTLTASNVAFSLIVTDIATRSAFATLRAEFTLGTSSTISMSTQYPDWTIDAYLKQGSTLDVTNLVTTFFGSDAGLPSLSVDELDISISSGNYSVHSSMSSDWEIIQNPLVISLADLEFAINHTDNATTASASATLYIGGIDFSLTAAYDAGWNFTGTAATETPISVSNLVNALLNDLGLSQLPANGPNIELSNLTASYNTVTKAYGFGGTSTAAFTLPFFDQNLNLTVQLQFNSTLNAATNARSYSAILSSTILIGHANFILQFQAMEAATLISGSWNSTDGSSIGFGDIASFLGISTAGISVPDGLDLGLTAVEFIMDISNRQFTLAAESQHFGTAFFTAGYDSNNALGFVFGVNFHRPSRFSEIPAVGQYLHGADFITIQDASIILSKGTFNHYTIPTLPTVGGATTTPVAAGATLKLVTGVTLSCDVDLASTAQRNTVIQNLNSIIDHSTLHVQLTFTPTTVSILSILNGSVTIPDGGSGLEISNPSLEIDIVPPQLVVKLSADFDFTIQGTAMNALIAMAISETEAVVTANLTVPNGSLPAPPGVKGLHMTGIGLLMGVFFEPPSILLGLQGSFRIGQVQTTDNRFSFVLQIIGEVINPLYLSFYIDHLDLGTIVTLFTDDEPTGEEMDLLNEVSASEVSFYWAETTVVLPDATTALPGFGFSGELDIFDFGMFVDAEIRQGSGIVGKAQTSPIDLKGVLQIEGDGKAITRKVNSTSNNPISNKLSIPKPVGTDKVVVSAGGPHFEINTSNSPFLVADWQISLFDIVRETIDVEVGTNGVEFDLTYSISGISSFVLKNTLNGWDNFNGSARFSLGIDETFDLPTIIVDLGSVRVNASVGATFFVILNPTTQQIGIRDLGFTFEGLSLTIPTITLDPNLRTLQGLPAAIIQQIRDHIGSIFNNLISDPLMYARFIRNGIIQAVEQLGVILNQAFGQTANQVASIMKLAGFPASEVADAIKGAFGDSVQLIGDALNFAGFTGSEVVSALYGIGATADQIGSFLNTLGLPTDQLRNIIENAAGVPADLLQSVGDILNIY